MKNYWELHNFIVVDIDNNRYRVTVPAKCSALGDNNLCTLYETAERPEVCNKLDYGDTQNYVITDGCLLLPDIDDSLEITKVDG